MSDHPIYDTLCRIYRYQGGWAFEDYGMGWRPWSEAWDQLCDAPYQVGYRSYSAETAKLREKLAWWGLSDQTHRPDKVTQVTSQSGMDRPTGLL